MLHNKKSLAVIVTAIMTIFMVFGNNVYADSPQPPQRCLVSNDTYGFIGDIYSVVKEIPLDRNTLVTSETAPPRLIITVTGEAGPDYSSSGKQSPIQTEIITISWFSKVSYGAKYGLCVENPATGSKQWLSQLDEEYQKRLFEEINKLVLITPCEDSKEN